MKLLISILTFFLSITPTFAAYNDVSLTTDAVITIGSINLTVSGSTASVESIVVGSSSFTVILQASSQITVRSSDMYTLTATGHSSQSTTECTSTYSSMTLSSNSSSPVEMEVTPTATTCTTPTSASGSGGGGGGGGGGNSARRTASTAPVVIVPSAAIPS